MDCVHLFSFFFSLFLSLSVNQSTDSFPVIIVSLLKWIELVLVNNILINCALINVYFK